MRKCQLYRQYFRVKNLTMKDHNTKYFTSIASFNRKHKKITRIVVDHRTLEGVTEIRSEVRRYFHKSYKQQQLPHIELPPDSFRKFSHSTYIFLQNIPTSEEMRTTVKL